MVLYQIKKILCKLAKKKKAKKKPMWDERIQPLTTQALKGSMISKVLRRATILKTKQNTAYFEKLSI